MGCVDGWLKLRSTYILCIGQNGKDSTHGMTGRGGEENSIFSRRLFGSELSDK